VRADFVTFTRFDLTFRRPWDALNIDSTKLTLPWKENKRGPRRGPEYADEGAWDLDRTSSDLFATMPAAYVGAYGRALDFSGDYNNVSNHVGAGHYVYRATDHTPRPLPPFH
jgi:hypothetical protein